jgi:hypothetical protein
MSRGFGIGIDGALLASQSTDSRGSVLLGCFSDRCAASNHRALVLSRHGRVLYLSRRSGAARDELDHVSIFAQPTMPGNFKEVSTFSRIWDQYPSEQIAGVRCDIFGECERSVDDVFVEQVDVVAFGVCGIVVKREIACQHGILQRS